MWPHTLWFMELFMEQQQLVWTRQLYYTVVEIVKTKKIKCSLLCVWNLFGTIAAQHHLSNIPLSHKKKITNMHFMYKKQ